MCAIVDRWTPRLENWALWAVSGSRTSTSNMFRVARGWNEGAPPQPCALIGEAYDVDSLVVRLPELLHTAIIITYCWSGSLRLRAAQAHINERTLRDRHRQAVYRLDDLHAQRKHAQALARARAAA